MMLTKVVGRLADVLSRDMRRSSAAVSRHLKQREKVRAAESDRLRQDDPPARPKGRNRKMADFNPADGQGQTVGSTSAGKGKGGGKKAGGAKKAAGTGNKGKGAGPSRVRDGSKGGTAKKARGRG